MLKDRLGFLKVGLRVGKFLALAFLFFFFLFPKNVEAAPTTDSMLGYWKFDGDATDFSGDGCTGAPVGTPAYASAAPTNFTNLNSIDFNGVSNYVDFSNQSNLRPGSALTFSFWINFLAIPSTGPAYIAGNYTGTYNSGFFFRVDTTNVTFCVGDGAGPYCAAFLKSLLTASTWRHFTGTLSGSTVSIYLDGVLMSSATFTGSIAYSTNIFRIGDFNGRMDDVRLYNRALSDLEISDLAASNHTSATWVGVNSDYEDVSNWDISAVPDPYTLVNINVGGSQPQFLSQPEQMAGLTINTGASLDILGNDLTLNDAGIFSNNGTFILQNGSSQSLTGFTNDTNSGTVRIDGTANSATLQTGHQYNNLTINSSAYTTALGANLVVNGNLALESGTLDVTAANYNISVGGDWTNAGGDFLPWSGTVTLNGIGQSMTGSNNFYNLTKSVSTADTLTFEAASNQVVLNNLTLQGVGSTGQFLSLRSSIPGTQWGIDPQGTINVSGVDVQDGYSGTTIVLPGINHDSGNNNINWVFDTAAPAISSITESVSSSGATISWTTNESASTQLEYGLTTGYGTASTETDIVSRLTSHHVSLSGLSSCKTYHYRVISRDASSNEGASSDHTFKTSGCSDSCSYDKPGTPDIDLAEAVDSNSIRLSINEASGTVDRYKLKYGTSSGGYQWSVDDIGGEGTDEFLVGHLSSGTTYYFKIKAVNKCEEGNWSDEASGKTDSRSVEQNSNSTTEEVSPVTSVPEAESLKPNFNESTSWDWQLKYFGSGYCYDAAKCAGSADPDQDGLDNNEEFRLGTNPNVGDSDGDGQVDGQEIETGHDPLKSAGTQEGDMIQYEDPKVSGEVERENYQVNNAELVDSGGEKKVKITGKAPPGSHVTLFIYSQPIVLTVKADSNGNWSYILDKNLEDGQHEVYVAVTDSTGKITAKSEPLFFAKTAEAISVIPSAEAARLAQATPPAEKRKNSYILYFIIVGIAGLVVAVVSIGYTIKGSHKKEETTVTT